MSTLDRTLKDIQRKYGRRVADAFADAVADINSRVVLARIVEQLEAGNIERSLGS